jgi:Fur family ferric uptake transcriptional regulator
MDTPGPSDLHDAVRRRLAEDDVRYTGGRKAIVAALGTAGGPQSAADLHRLVAGVPLSSLYRSLTVLDEAGVLKRNHDADGLARFELAEWLGGHHHHITCVECGAVEDVRLEGEEERLLAAVIQAMGDRTGYIVRDHELELEGACPSCRS